MQQPTETDRLLAEIMTHQLVAGRRRVAFVEYQVDHMQYRLQSLRQLLLRRHFIRNARIADLRLGAHDALRQRGGRRSEEHTSELQSRENLVCRLLLEKK